MTRIAATVTHKKRHLTVGVSMLLILSVVGACGTEGSAPISTESGTNTTAESPSTTDIDGQNAQSQNPDASTDSEVVVNLDSGFAGFPGELIELSVATAVPAIEFTGNVDEPADYYSERGGDAVLEDGRIVTIWGQLPNGDYAASATRENNGNVETSFGALNIDGEFAAFGGRKATSGYVISATVKGGYAAWVSSTDEMMYPYSWELFVWDGNTDVAVADNSMVPDATGLVPWSLGLNENGQASFATVSGDSEFYFHVGDGEDFRSNPDIPVSVTEHPVSVGSGFLYAEHQKDATVLSFQGLNPEDPTHESINLFALNGPVTQDTPLIGNHEMMGIQYNQGAYEQKPHWFAINSHKTRLVSLDLTDQEPSSSMMCGSQMVWLTFDGDQNNSVLWHVDTAAEEPTVRYIDLIDPGSLVCGNDHTIIFSGFDPNTGENSYWNYTFDAGA